MSPYKILACPGGVFKERTGSPRPSIGNKNHQKKNPDQREYEKFEMALQHISKLQVYSELKREIGFEEY